MKSPIQIKEMDVIYEKEMEDLDLKYIKNVNVDEIIDIVLSFNSSFFEHANIFITTKEICDCLTELKDRNTIFVNINNSIYCDFMLDIRHRSINNKQILDEGGVTLSMKMDNDKRVVQIWLYFIGTWSTNICSIMYDFVEKEYFCKEIQKEITE
jgi:hypothetical protein